MHSRLDIFRMARGPLSEARSWLAGAAIALVAAGILFCSPGQLANGEHLDPLFRAEELISRGDYGNALRQLSRMKTEGLEPWDAQKVSLQRAVCRYFLGRYGEALSGFRAMGERSEHIEDYLAFWQGRCFEELGRPDSAASHYARILHMEPSSLLRDSAALRATGLHLKRGRAAQAVELFRRLLGNSDQEVDALAGLAEALEAAGDSTEARNMRLRLVRDYPEAPQALAALGRMEPLGRAQERFYGGVAYARHREFRKAIVLFRQVIQDAPSGTWQGRAQYELGVTYYERRDYRTAERVFEKAHRIYHVPKALFQMGRCSAKLGRNLKAAEHFQAFARLYPSLSGAGEALWNAAMAFERLKRYRQSRKIFLKLVSRYPRSSFADKGGWRAGFALYRMGDYEKAADVFLRLSENTAESHIRDQGFYWAGKCYRQLGDKEQEIHWMRQAAEGFPASYYSARARAVLGLNSRVYPEAPEPDRMAAESAYEPSSYLLKGDMLAALGLYRMAEHEYRRAERVHRNDLFALGDLKQRYERIRAMNRALQVSYAILDLEQRKGIPMTLASFRRLYPTYYWGEVSRTAEEMKVNPNLIMAIMRQESAFNEDALSPVGARGLMQVMPKTGKGLARRIRLKGFAEDDLWEPRTSIRLGTRHLSDHLRYFDKRDSRRLGLALSAYNAGLRAARRWSRQLPKKDVDEFVESIPYRETRKYVKLVYRNYQVYSYLLDGHSPQGREEGPQ